MRKSIFATLGSVATIVGCGKSSLRQASSPSIIIGDDDQKPIGDRSDRESLAPLVPAIGKMSNNCTAFHLGNGLVATAGHCLKPEQGLPDVQSCPEVAVKWGKDIDTRPQQISHCVEILTHELNQTKDYTLFIADPIPEVALTWNSSDTIPESALVIGFPSDGSLSVSGPCAAIAGTPEDINHDCDTRPGNSGSPIIDAKSMAVFGIHDGGYDAKNYGTSLPQEMVHKVEELVKVRYGNANNSEPAYTYGPFENNRKDLIHFVPQKQGTTASFSLDIDTEEGYDEARVTDGTGRIRSYSGQKTIQFNSLPTPILVDFVSDYAGNSKRISILNVHLNK